MALFERSTTTLSSIPDSLQLCAFFLCTYADGEVGGQRGNSLDHPARRPLLTNTNRGHDFPAIRGETVTP
jgi:hypothetical protein